MLPKLISIGSFWIPTYGVLVALGFLLGLWITLRLAHKAGLPGEQITNLAVYCALAGLAGAKLFMILFDLGEYVRHPETIFSLATLRAAGVYQGGLLLALLVAVLYMRRVKLPVLETCDIFSPGIAAGHVIGRIGCFAAGCCYGAECDRPWAVTFHNPAAQELVGTPLNVPLHPTQLYEAGSELLMFLLLYWHVRRQHAPGETFGLYLVLYSVSRFIIEFFRFHEQGLHYGLSFTQWISIGTLLAGTGLLIARRNSPKLVAVG